MPFDDDVRELEDGDLPTLAIGPRPSPFAWLPPTLWTCPRCTASAVTREASPRCGRCGFKEGT